MAGFFQGLRDLGWHIGFIMLCQNLTRFHCSISSETTHHNHALAVPEEIRKYPLIGDRQRSLEIRYPEGDTYALATDYAAFLYKAAQSNRLTANSFCRGKFARETRGGLRNQRWGVLSCRPRELQIPAQG